MSRTLLSILADLNDAVIWMVSIPPLISNRSVSIFKTLGTIPSTLTTIIIPSSACSKVFFFSSKFLVLVYLFALLSAGITKSTRSKVPYLFFSFFCCCSLVLGLAFGKDQVISKYQRIISISFSWTDSGFWQHGQISIFCTILSASVFPPNHTYTCTPFVLVCCIRLQCD